MDKRRKERRREQQKASECGGVVLIDGGYGWTIITFFSSLKSCSDDGALSNCIHRAYVCVYVSANHQDDNEQYDEM